MAPPTGNAVTVGTEVLEPGDAAVTIDEVSLVDADGLALIGSYVTAVVNTTTVGSWNSFPPTPADLAENGYLAEELVAAEGATLDPGMAPAWNLVLGLQVEEHRAAGQAGRVQVAYHAGRRDYVWRSSTELEVRLHPQVCA